MKRIITILSILVLCLIAGPPNLALAAISDNDTIWWSVSEMLEFARQVDVEEEERCHDDIDCRREYLSDMQEKDDRYRALENFLQAQVWLTAINPGTETIKVLFFDEDMMLRRMGIKEQLSLEHIYFGWFEQHSEQIFNYNHEQFTNGSIEGIHTIYDGSSDTNGENWIPAWREVELSVAGANLALNLSGEIGYAVFANSFNAQGRFDYSSCLNADDYETGMECRMMISADRGTSYFPPRSEIELNEPTAPSASTSTGTEGDSSTESGADSNVNPNTGPSEDANSDSSANANASDAPASDTDSAVDFRINANADARSSGSDTDARIDIGSISPLSPVVNSPYREPLTLADNNTGIESALVVDKSFQTTKDLAGATTGNQRQISADLVNLPLSGELDTKCEKKVIFPWWLIVLLVIGDLLVMWFFWPRGRERNSR